MGECKTEGSAAGRIRVLGAPKRDTDAACESRVYLDPLRVEFVENALIPAATRHDIEPFQASGDWLFKGWKAGVYHADRIICETSLIDRWHTNVSTAYEPDEIDIERFEYIPGEAVYGGLLFGHFGHFLLESTNRLWWPIANGFDGLIVFQAVGKGQGEHEFIDRFFRLAGMADRVRVIFNRGLRFDSVIVPQRSFVIKKYWSKEFRVPFRYVGAAAERMASLDVEDVNTDGLFLSRARYDYRRSYGEKRLERVFARNGFRAVYPETMALEQQILLSRHHRIIAGIQGSAFHTILFSDYPKEALYICRDYEINANFFMIDEMMNNSSTYIYSGVARDAMAVRLDRNVVADDYRQDATLDLSKILWFMERPGILSKTLYRGGSR